MRCRACGSRDGLPVIDLGTAPPSNAYLSPERLNAGEAWYPLKLFVCQACWLAQVEDYTGADELFAPDYAYFSSFSRSWLAHAERFVGTACARFELGPASRVVEVAANDGYLLQYVRARGIPCLGIEPTASTAAAARAKGLPIVEAFFGRELAERLKAEGQGADLMVANNVLAHVPDINDFVAGFAILLNPGGVASFEFPHLAVLIRDRLFDTIYHEHYSYLSLSAVAGIFERNGLQVFDVERLRTHGGSLRVWAQRVDSGRQVVCPRVTDTLAEEAREGVCTPAYYAALEPAAIRIKHALLRFLLQAKAEGKRVAAYGAAAKGNTLLNFAGVRRDLLAYVVDANPAKQGKYLPGSRIPVVAEDHMKQDRPDYVLLLPWNLVTELEAQLAYARAWGACFVVTSPILRIW
ncbi:MAG: class I SAM-dependent methyltransferase [Gammaproteobacteria bacterium]|nr:class I SAM-dependent methyltransferase [Gammaproteobacteria bacterium]